MSQRDVWTGMFTVGGACVALAVWAALALSERRGETTTYVLEASELAGVTVGTTVEMRGYDLGRVDAVRVIVEPTLRFELDLGLRPEVPIPVGTRAILATRTLAGGALVVLDPPDAPTTSLAPGARMPAVAQADVTRLLETAGAILEDLAVVSAEVRRAVADREQGDDLRASLDRFNRDLEEANAVLSAATDLVGNVDALVARVGPRVERGLSAADRALAHTEGAAAQMERLLAPDGPTMAVLSDMSRRLDELEQLAALLEAYDPARNAGLADTLENVRAASTSLERLMRAMERRPLRTLVKGVPPEP